MQQKWGKWSSKFVWSWLFGWWQFRWTCYISCSASWSRINCQRATRSTKMSSCTATKKFKKTKFKTCWGNCANSLFPYKKRWVNGQPVKTSTSHIWSSLKIITFSFPSQNPKRLGCHTDQNRLHRAQHFHHRLNPHGLLLHCILQYHRRHHHRRLHHLPPHLHDLR